MERTRDGIYTREWTVYFQIGGRKMKRNLTAETEAEAREKLLAEIKIDAVRVAPTGFNKVLDGVADLLDALYPDKT